MLVRCAKAFLTSNDFILQLHNKLSQDFFFTHPQIDFVSGLEGSKLEDFAKILSHKEQNLW
jgi:hypothetical protein